MASLHLGFQVAWQQFANAFEQWKANDRNILVTHLVSQYQELHAFAETVSRRVHEGEVGMISHILYVRSFFV